MIGGADLCDLFGITPGALTGLVKRGVVIRLKHDAYDLVASTQGYCAHLRETASGRGGEEHVLHLTRERARYARAQAEQVEMKNATMRGELVSAEEVARAWSDVLRGLRSRILAVPSRVCQSLGLGKAEADALDRELRAALAELGGADAG